MLDNKLAGLDRFAGKVEMMKNVRKPLKWVLIRALVHVHMTKTKISPNVVK